MSIDRDSGKQPQPEQRVDGCRRGRDRQVDDQVQVDSHPGVPPENDGNATIDDIPHCGCVKCGEHVVVQGQCASSLAAK